MNQIHPAAPQRRRHARVKAPGIVEIGDAHRFRVLDLSVSGMHFDCDGHAVDTGATFAAELVINVRGVPQRLPVKFQVRRFDAQRHRAAAAFVGLGEREQAVLQQWVRAHAPQVPAAPGARSPDGRAPALAAAGLRPTRAEMAAHARHAAVRNRDGLVLAGLLCASVALGWAWVEQGSLFAPSPSDAAVVRLAPAAVAPAPELPVAEAAVFEVPPERRVVPTPAPATGVWRPAPSAPPAVPAATAPAETVRPHVLARFDSDPLGYLVVGRQVSFAVQGDNQRRDGRIVRVERDGSDEEGIVVTIEPEVALAEELWGRTVSVEIGGPALENALAERPAAHDLPDPHEAPDPAEDPEPPT